MRRSVFPSPNRPSRESARNYLDLLSARVPAVSNLLGGAVSAQAEVVEPWDDGVDLPADDLINNPSPRCACMLVLDTSASMSGNWGEGRPPIHQLNEGLVAFVAALQSDEIASFSVELSIITVGGVVTEVLPFTTAAQVEECPRFPARGDTPLGGGIKLALQRLEERKAEYKRCGVPYYQPWLVVISDGAPTDGYQWTASAEAARTLSAERRLVSLMVGVEYANLSRLSAASTRPALKLKGLNFAAFFEWLSVSMSRVSASTSVCGQIHLPPVDSWATI